MTLATRNKGPKTLSDFKNWRFHTFNSKFEASYNEVWIKIDFDRYQFSSIKLNIYDAVSRIEILSLHCEPYDSKESKITENIYQRGFHFVIEKSQIPKAHLALTSKEEHLNEVLCCIDEFNKAMEFIIGMIKGEILIKKPDKTL
ncbi:hypothetical protein KKB18_12855 [bacterium]|nr:hypothetical protein [bacterium]